METGKIILLIINREEILLIMKNCWGNKWFCENIKIIKIGTEVENLERLVITKGVENTVKASLKGSRPDC